MGRTAAIYRIHPYNKTSEKLEVVLENDKWAFLDSVKYHELSRKRSVGTYMGDEAVFAVDGFELNDLLETTEYDEDDIFLIIRYL